MPNLKPGHLKKNCTYVCFLPVQDQNDGVKKRIKAPFPQKRDFNYEREERHNRRTSHPLANFVHLFIGVPFFEVKLVFFMIIDNSCLYRKLTLGYNYHLLCWLFYDQELTDLLIYNNKPRT